MHSVTLPHNLTISHPQHKEWLVGSGSPPLNGSTHQSQPALNPHASWQWCLGLDDSRSHRGRSRNCGRYKEPTKASGKLKYSAPKWCCLGVPHKVEGASHAGSSLLAESLGSRQTALLEAVGRGQRPYLNSGTDPLGLGQLTFQTSGDSWERGSYSEDFRSVRWRHWRQ